MKKVLFCLSAFLLLLSACTKSEIGSDVAVDMTITASIGEGNDTKTQLDANTLAAFWEVGDKIKLFDSQQNSAVWKVKSIKDGVATFAFVEGSAMSTGRIMAYYPAESAIEAPTNTSIKVNVPSSQKYVSGSFGTGAAPMVAVAEKIGDDVHFNFVNLFGAFKYNLDAGSARLHKVTLMSSQALCGEGTVNLSNPAAPTISFTSGANTVSVDDIDVTGTVTFYVPVPPATNHQLTILADITDNGNEIQKIKDSNKPHEVAWNRIREFNPIALSSLTEVQGAANCYMVDCVNASEIIIPLSQVMSGWNAIKSYGETEVRPEDVSTIIGSGRWEIVPICNTTSAAFDVATKLVASNGVYYGWKLKTPANVGGNNEIFALKATANCNTVQSGDILWSWHIWFTDYKPAATQANTVGGQVVKLNGAAFTATNGVYYGDHPMMDRNLGATITGVATGACIAVPETKDEYKATVGLQYAYGRKDPVVQRSSATGQISYTQSVKDPQLFYVPASGAEWCLSEVSTPWGEYSNNSKVGVMNPCPVGWEVASCGYQPWNNAFAGLGNGDPASIKEGIGASYFAPVNDSNNTYRGRMYDNDGVQVYFPGQTGGAFFYWGRQSSTVKNGAMFYYSVGKVTPGSANGDSATQFRSKLFNIRCVKR